MTPHRHDQIERLFHAVLEIEPDRRSAFLDEACSGDPDLRQEVDSLLKSHDDAGEFIAAPAVEVAARTLVEAASPVVPGARIDHYELLSLLGSGGMGDVFLARDTQLDRKVAIKFLQPQMMSDPRARERLVREARAAAKLDHPNICAIHQVVDHEDRNFIVMQHVEGETLAAHIARGPLPIERVLNITAQVASALAEAHAKGIAQRDIKPQNIMITPSGRVQVLDFGLARVVDNASMSSDNSPLRKTLTQEGLVAGTVAYMSPEQLRGETVDARTDIFSLGIVIYEMLTGRQPFIADSRAETVAGILKSEPASPRQFVPQVPESLVAIIDKALKKEKAERYASGAEILKDLQVRPRRPLVWPRLLKYGAAAALLVLAVWKFAPWSGNDTAIRSIAVLPLENLSGEPNQEYFSAGITESLISTLAQIRSLKVVSSRTSVMRYKGTDKPLREIGRELGADAILEGSVQRAGGTGSHQRPVDPGLHGFAFVGARI
jgi:serine/threonine protein kinase